MSKHTNNSIAEPFRKNVFFFVLFVPLWEKIK